MPGPHHPAAEDDDRQSKAYRRDDQEPGPGINSLACSGSFKPCASNRVQPFELRPDRLYQFDLDCAVAALGRRQHLDPVGTDTDLVAEPQHRGFDGLAIELQPRVVEAFDPKMLAARHQDRRPQTDMDIVQRHLIIRAAPDLHAFTAGALRPAYYRGAAPAEKGDLNFHAPRRNRVASRSSRWASRRTQ